MSSGTTRGTHAATLLGFSAIWISAVFARTDAVQHVQVVRANAIDYRGAEVTTDNLHQFLEDHEKVMLFGQSNAHFVIAHVARTQRTRRSTDQSETTVRLSMPIIVSNVSSGAAAAGDTDLQLHLQPSQRLIDDAFVYIKRFENSSVLINDFHKLAEQIGGCFYRDARAALDLCDDGVRGIVRHNERAYLIHPLPGRFGRGAHVIVDSNATAGPVERRPSDHAASVPAHHHHCATGDGIHPSVANVSLTARSQRRRRFISGTNRVPRVLHIETAVFVDKDLYRHMMKNYATDTESKLIRFVLAMINGVQLLYHHPSLGHEINFVLKRLEILHNDPKGLQRSSDIDVFLNSFCLWQRKFNPVSDADAVHFDHAVILTGLDLYVVGKNGKISSQVVGLAPVAGMCTATSSCTINEGKHFESVFVVAHEIGHNLGMRHDSAENNCDPSLFIMSPTLGSGKTTWSKCSRNYLKAFLSTHQAKCMFDRGHFGTNLDHGAESLLPGERFDADQQCLLKYGKNSVRSASQQLAEVCRDLHCQRDRYTWTSHPSLEGTHCGMEMWCRAGTCVSRNANTDQAENIASTALHVITANSSKLTDATSDNPASSDAVIDNIDSSAQPIAAATATADEPADSGRPAAETTASADVPQSSTAAADLTITKASLWSDWAPPTDCESGCLFGESGRLREGSTGLRVFTRVCLDTRSRRSCKGQDRRYEACSSRQCYNVPRTTVLEFAQQVCERARKFDKDIVAQGVQEVGATANESCRVFCRSKAPGSAPKTKSWTFPDGTTCRNRDSDVEDRYYCVAGNCERFTCSNRTTNLYRADSIYCPESVQQSENNVLQERVRDFKSVSLKSHPHSEKLMDGGGGSGLRRAKYTAPPMPPHPHLPPQSTAPGNQYDIPYFRPNARSWRYKGFEVTRVPKYRSHTSEPISYRSSPPLPVFPTSPDYSPSAPSAPPFEPTASISSDFPPTSSSSSSRTSSLSLASSPQQHRWNVRSGCHFGCIEQSKGIQIVETYTPDRKSNIQLCEAEPIACDNVQTAVEYAQKLCYRYTLKVRGLSGHGTQILASAGDPDRACKVACQDEFLLHRYYLVYGDQGHFPFGTKCSARGSDDNRYCVNGKCLEFGPDDVPLQESHLSLALYRSRRELTPVVTSQPSRRRRMKRNFVYYSPINITEHITPELLQSIVDSLTLSRRYDDMPILGDHIDFLNPVHFEIDDY